MRNCLVQLLAGCGPVCVLIVGVATWGLWLWL